MEAPAPPTAARTPRAGPTLPANPFGDLDARDLSSFVECTLYEIDGDGDDTDPDFPIHVTAPERPRPRAAAAPARAGAPTPATGPQARGRRGRAIALCAACACLGLGVAFLIRRPQAIAEQAPASSRLGRQSATRAAAPAPAREATAPVVEPIVAEVQPEAPAAPSSAAVEAPATRLKTARLIIGSSPPGAAIAVNGEPFGAAPTRLEVPRFAEVEIEATLAGYVPWKKTVYVRQAETRIGTSLKRVAAEATDDDAKPTEP
jgi:hypothetical protein